MFAVAGISLRITGADSNDPKDIAKEFGHPGESAVRWEPEALAGTGIKLAIGRRGDGKPMILHYGAGVGGGRTFTSGWAVESELLRTETGDALVGVTIPEAAAVRFGKGRDALRAPTAPMPGDSSKRVFAVHVPVDGLSLVHANDIVALDAQGRLLGRQHVNDGRGGFGAYDGIYDRKWR
ncbi:hypothetical protein DVA67_025575 [Solirubrobacter sp. CPCC 204708]|uniref:Uncharacterized protein n=1 Tax=Solirubrobacter deserti TaxID=2282478 RepID=A0ABT4RQY3_9ACTN|nr:hypothetical protein [Solirubrobacter deserti]MBE2319372.1 hypothetical protein [Solirubrobacter deserti]MDA0140870.1 hypothetical protein [Solirubrobacter deserti]